MLRGILADQESCPARFQTPKEGEGVVFSASVTHRFQVGMRWILVLERRRRTRGFAPHAIGKLVTPPPAPPQLDVTWSLLSGLTV